MLDTELEQFGGSWAGVGIALGVSLIIAWILGLEWSVRTEIIQTVTTVALLVGILAFLIHYSGHPSRWRPPATKAAAIRHNMADLYRDRHLGKQLGKQLKQTRHKAMTGLPHSSGKSNFGCSAEKVQSWTN